MCNISTFLDWWVKWKIGSWSIQIWLKNTLDRDLSMMKLLLLFNEFFLYLDALHRNLNFLEQTCTFLHSLTQLSSLSYVCLICRGIFNFAAAFLSCLGFIISPCLFILPQLFFYFASAFLCCCGFFVLPWFFSFAMTVTFLFCCEFFILPRLCCRSFCFAVTFCFAVAFLFCRGFLVLPWHLWPITATAKTKRNTVKKEILINEKKSFALI